MTGTGSNLRRPWLQLLVRRLPLIALFVVAGVAAGYEAVPAQGGYSSTAVLFVGSPKSSPDVFFNSQTQQGQELLAVTFAAMVDTPAVAQAAATGAGVPGAAGTALAETRASVVPNTSLIQVTATDANPYTAQKLANAMAAAAVAHIGAIDPVKSASGTGSATSAPLQVSQPAGLNLYRPPRRVKHYVGEGAAFGLVVGAALVLLFDYLARRPEERAPDRLAAPVLAGETADL